MIKSDEFRARVRVNRSWLDQYYATLFGEIDILRSEGRITSATADVMARTLKCIQAHATEMESDYYEMANLMEDLEKVPLGKPS